VPLVSLHNKLVGAADHLDVACLVELREYVRAEYISCPSRTDSPSLHVLGASEQVAHGAVVENLLFAVDCADLVKGLDRRLMAAVDTKDLQGVK
jgi:hypothetical protein